MLFTFFLKHFFLHIYSFVFQDIFFVSWIFLLNIIFQRTMIVTIIIFRDAYRYWFKTRKTKFVFGVQHGEQLLFRSTVSLEQHNVKIFDHKNTKRWHGFNKGTTKEETRPTTTTLIFNKGTTKKEGETQKGQTSGTCIAPTRHVRRSNRATDATDVGDHAQWEPGRKRGRVFGRHVEDI